MAEITVTKDNFEEEVLKSELPVLVDFWAPWCGPCRMLAPAVAQIAEEFEGKAKVCKINVDEEEELSAQFGIASIPTVLIFRNGEVTETSVGLRSKAQLAAMLA